MNEVLKCILSLSLSGSLLILPLLLFRPLYRKRLGKTWQYYIWLVVIARLLLPFGPEPGAVGALFHEIESSAGDGFFAEQNFQTPSGGVFLPEGDTAPVQENPPQKLPQNEKPEIYLWLVWLMGAVILLIRKITVYQSFAKYIRVGCTDVTNLDLLEQFGALAEKAKMKQAVELSVNSLISSPLLIGFFRPRVVLPSCDMPERDFRYTVMHELIHGKRLDMFYKWLVQFALCIHWFNPLVYFMEREIRRTCELSCDETLVMALDHRERQAYGATLLNAMKAKGAYKDSLASVTLNESKELLKERLEAIMSFQKKSGLCAVVSIVLVFALGIGAVAAGAYGFLPVNSPMEKTAATPENTPFPSSKESPQAVSFPQAEASYRLAELRSLDISGVSIEAASEDVSIVRGGNTLKFEYFTDNPGDYTLQRESDGGGTRWNLCLKRTSSAKAGEPPRPITVTIPDELTLKTLVVTTDSGNILFENCDTTMYMTAESQTGQIFLDGGSSKGYFFIKAAHGNALISGTTLPALGTAEVGTIFETEDGSILFQPAGSAWDYRYNLDTGEDARITVNGKQFQGGGGNINSYSESRIYFESNNGTLVVQDLSMGKLTLPKTAVEAAFTAQPHSAPAQNNKDASVKKEYTETDLQRMGITGLRVEAKTEHITVSQGGTSLILEYPQSVAGTYSLGTQEYEIYNGEFTTPEEIAKYGGKSGTVTELLLTSTAVEDDTPRTLRITLPADPQYSRVVQLFSHSGNIQLEECKSTAMLSASTDSGTIHAQGCTSPLLGVKTRSGAMDVSDCAMQELNAQTYSGAFSLALPDDPQNYEMKIDTGALAQISIAGKTYPGGELLLNKNAANLIQFDCRTGSLVITNSKGTPRAKES